MAFPSDMEENYRKMLDAEQAKYGRMLSADPELGPKLLLESAFLGNAVLVEWLLRYGVPIDTADKATGMTALHLAVGANHLELTKTLVTRGASFVPDKKGRMPTIIAARCMVSEELGDFIVEAEARARGV